MTVGSGMLIGGSRTTAGNLATMHQAPMTPWRDEVEAEEYARDPKAFLMDRCLLWLPACHLMRDLVLCATYYLPAFEFLPNGTKFYRTDTSHNEALWQGKVGLVIAKGPMAFVDEPALGIHFHGQDVEIGDWVQWDIHDARQHTIDRIHCRALKDTQIIAKWDDPRLVY
jgi:hypothetical protein